MHTLGLLALAVAVGAAADKVVVLEAGGHTSAASARAVWKPIEASPPVDTTPDGVLRLPCPFKTHTNWRVGWDKGGPWDLAGCRRIEIDLKPDGDRARTMVAYLESGGGWYRARLDVLPGVPTVRLAQRQFRTEGRPAGWGRVTRVRLAVVRDGPTNGAVTVKAIRAVLGDAAVAVYRNDAGLKHESGIDTVVQSIAGRLERLGLDPVIVDDRAVADGRLAKCKVAILPLNPLLPDAAAKALERYTAGGGKLIVCYCLPGPLARLLGVRQVGFKRDPSRQAFAAFDWRPDAAAKPERVEQRSWNIRCVRPASGTHVKAYWVNADGQVSDEPAVTRNANGYFIGHILTDAAPKAKDRLLMGMVADLWPGAWRQAYEHRLGRVGSVAGLPDRVALKLAMAANLAAHPDRSTVQGMAGTADLLVAEARRAARQDRFGWAVEQLDQAQHLYERAYASSIPSKPGERRAVWCHSPRGVAGRTWDEAIERLAEAGFNMVIPNMLWGGGAAYPSDVLPAIPEVKEHGDLLAQCVAAGAKHGVAVHVWKVNWRLWRGAPDAFRKKMRADGRMQVGPKGEPIDWLCPSHPDNQRLETLSMLEVVRKYDVAGVHFDYIRYPGHKGCYCNGCRTRFEQQIGRRVARWPQDVLDGPLKAAYLQFRRDQITRVVEATSRQAHRLKPAIQVSAAVFWHWPTARDQVGQDWKLWVERGYLDFVCPMAYTPSCAAFESRVRQTKAWTGSRTPLLPGIGATLGQRPDQTLQQVLIARRHATAGFVLFNYDAALAGDYLDILMLGATRGAPNRDRRAQ